MGSSVIGLMPVLTASSTASALSVLVRLLQTTMLFRMATIHSTALYFSDVSLSTGNGPVEAYDCEIKGKKSVESEALPCADAEESLLLDRRDETEAFVGANELTDGVGAVGALSNARPISTPGGSGGAA